MRNVRFFAGRRVGPIWIGVSVRPGRHRYRHYATWRYVLGGIVGLIFFICVMGVVFG